MYCTKCGEKIIEIATPKKEKGKIATTNKITLIIVMLITASLLFMLIYPYAFPHGFTRMANREDIEIDYKVDLTSRTLEVIITPNSDIKELEIYISYKDSDGNVILDRNKTVGSVKTGIQVHKYFALGETAAENLKKGGIINIQVKKGYVPYIQ